MRIVIDMQGAQSESRFRGIGRYTMSFTQAIVRNRGDHEIILALNGLFPDTIEPIRAAFDSLLPQENIRVWYAPGPVKDIEPGNEGRREVAEVIREAFLASLQPDIIHISSLFEGFCDDVVTSIGRFDQYTPVSVSLYDLIPLLNPEKFLDPNPLYKKNYLRKLQHLKQASLFLGISDSTLCECAPHIPNFNKNAVNVSAAIESHFEQIILEDHTIENIKNKFGIMRPFIFYTGGADDHKNLPRLIEAFGALKGDIRSKYQLVFGGRSHNIPHLEGIAKSNHLGDNDLIFTGYISDEELLQLYNISQIVAFPSWHEGFGLPVLEAMSCGAPVICGNKSSLPEVIGLAEAMFDPLDVKSISTKMSQALEDESFRARLRSHGLKRAKLFSWDESAKKAIAGFEKLHARSAENHQPDFISSSQKLIQAILDQHSIQDISLPALSGMLGQNFDCGIERQLLVDVSELCQRDSATGVQRVVRSYLFELLLSPPKGFRVEPVYATREEGYRYARNFKNRFLGLSEAVLPEEEVRCQRGDIFFALDMQHHVQLSHSSFYSKIRANGVTVKFLVHDLLPIQLPNLFLHSDASQLHEQLMTIVARSDEAICVSKATADALLKWIKENNIPTSPNFSATWVHNGSGFDCAKPSKGISADELGILQRIRLHPAFLCVSTIEPRKGQEQILNAFELLWSHGQELNLVFVGQQGWKMEPFAHRLKTHPENGKKLFWLNGISDECLEKVYAASTCLVAASLNEGFGLPLIEAARHRLSIIARDIPVFREVAGEGAYYFKGFQESDLAKAVADWIKLYKQSKHPKSDSLQWSTWKESTEKLKESLTKKNYPRKQIFLDISELVQRDVGTGIQRVVRSILKESLANPPSGYRIELVYATTTQGYRYAKQFSWRFDPLLPHDLQDEPIDFAPGDIFFGLDLQPQVQVAQKDFYRLLRTIGVKTGFLIHDLLPINMPEYFPPGTKAGFEEWLKVATSSEIAICVSKSSAADLRRWLYSNSQRDKSQPFRIEISYNGADTSHRAPLLGLPTDSDKVLSTLKQRKTFLIVGTIEPRKGQAQVLLAFEALWRGGVDVNLVIVGKQGWMVDDVCEKLRTHAELNQRLFWLEGISDEYLEKVYAACTCLIAASYGEGFGLPLIEAAQHGLPILARDIPVFREVAGENAFYFGGLQSQELQSAIQAWLALDKQGKAPQSNGLAFLSWMQSARNLNAILTSEKVESKPQLFVDISNLINYGDQRTGVHRVVRSILRDWFENPPEDYDICPVFAGGNHSYRYARGSSFKANMSTVWKASSEPIKYKKGDIFLGLDLDHENPRRHNAFLRKLRNSGVRVVFVVYDLLPIHFPHFWEPQHRVDIVHQTWLRIVSKMDGVVCISKAVADEMKAWRQEHDPLNDKPFQIDWFHLGADINSSLPTTGFPEDYAAVLQIFRERFTFLMIGTIEPRKGHAQVLDAFEILWRDGIDKNLVIVGKQGWLVDELCEKIRSHPELNKRLFWLEGISDEYLEKVYAASSCLIAASYGEGFGLPLIEAAQKKIPILVRDIPVFREVAGEHAAYFTAETPQQLAQAIQNWARNFQAGTHPKSDEMKYLTWAESARMLMEKICVCAS